MVPEVPPTFLRFWLHVPFQKKNPLLACWTLRKLRPQNATCVRLAPPIPVRVAAALLGGRLPISSSGRDSQSVKACLTHSRHNGLIQVCIFLCIQCAIQSYRHMRRKQALSILALIPHCNPCDPPSQWKSIPSSNVWYMVVELQALACLHKLHPKESLCAPCRLGTWSEEGQEMHENFDVFFGKLSMWPLALASAQGAGACSLCSAGRFGASQGLTLCSPCPSGTYSNQQAGDFHESQKFYCKHRKHL